MKKLSILLFIVLLVNSAWTQGCLPEGITFTTQEQIDSFPINYPNTSIIDGKVSIKGEDITNLDSLISIIRIEGSLSFENPVNLQSTTGFAQLEYVGLSLGLENCDKLINLEGLENLDTIGSSISITSCSLLENLKGLDNLKYCGGALVLRWNTSLVNLSGLENLTKIRSNVYITYNWLLQDFTGLQNVMQIDGYLIFAWNYEMTSINGLDNVEYIAGDLLIFSNGSITNLNGLSNLDSIAGDLSISNENSLTDISGIGNIAAGSIGALEIRGNNLLSNCDIQCICDYLIKPNGRVTIYNNADGCEGVGEIAESCGINLPCLPYGDYFFTKQAEIDSFQVDFPECDSLIGSVFIMGDDITDLAGLNNMTLIEEDLIIIENPILKSLDGLENLSKVWNSLYIGEYEYWPHHDDGNQSLTDLTALSNLTNVGINLFIGNNDSLSSLSGLDNINYQLYGELSIHSNPLLSNCAVKSICDYVFVSGQANIYYNATGCNSDDEVREACLVSTHVISLSQLITVYPNPFTTTTTIEYNLNQPSEVTLTIFNNLGKQTDFIRHNQTSGQQQIKWNAESLPAGMYFYTLKTGDQVVTGKLLKID